jgi:hypothetical protein
MAAGSKEEPLAGDVGIMLDKLWEVFDANLMLV